MRYTLNLNTKGIPTHTLSHCGTIGYVFIDQDFTDCHDLPLYCLKTPHGLAVIHGQKISSYNIMHILEAYLSIHEYHEMLPMFITKLGHYPIMLGIPWLKQHDIAIYFASNLVISGSQYCLGHCNDRAVRV
jgi:hypothetical protein